MTEPINKTITERDLKKLNKLFIKYNKEYLEDYSMVWWKRLVDKLYKLPDPVLHDKGLTRMIYDLIDNFPYDDITVLYSCTYYYLFKIISYGVSIQEYKFKDVVKDYTHWHLMDESKIKYPEIYEIYKSIDDNPRFWELVDEIESLMNVTK